MQELLVQILVNQKKDSNLNLEKKRESSPMSFSIFKTNFLSISLLIYSIENSSS